MSSTRPSALCSPLPAEFRHAVRAMSRVSTSCRPTNAPAVTASMPSWTCSTLGWSGRPPHPARGAAATVSRSCTGGLGEPVEPGDKIILDVRPDRRDEHGNKTDQQRLWQLLTMRQGKIVRIQDYTDQAAALQAAVFFSLPLSATRIRSARQANATLRTRPSARLPGQPVWISNQTDLPSPCPSPSTLASTPQRVASAATSPSPRPLSVSLPASLPSSGSCGLVSWTSTRTASAPERTTKPTPTVVAGVWAMALVTSSPANSATTSIRASSPQPCSVAATNRLAVLALVGAWGSWTLVCAFGLLAPATPSPRPHGSTAAFSVEATPRRAR
jgi:hypothetical protein